MKKMTIREFKRLVNKIPSKYNDFELDVDSSDNHWYFNKDDESLIFMINQKMNEPKFHKLTGTSEVPLTKEIYLSAKVIKEYRKETLLNINIESD